MMPCSAASMSLPSSTPSFITRVLFAWFLAALPVGMASGQDALDLRVADEAVLVLAPGSVGSRPIQIHNTGDVPLTARLRPVLPTGWSILIPPPSVVVQPGTSTSQLLTFTVPSDAIAADYEIVISTEADEENRLTLRVTVPARPQVSAEWLDTQELVRAGSRIEATLRVTNTGNAPTRWEIESRSSLTLPTDVRPAFLDLEEGESASVDLVVNTSDDITNRLTHALSVAIRAEGSTSDGSQEVSKQLTLNTDIYPTRARSQGRSENAVPATFTATATTEDGTHAGQLELFIPETQVQGKVIEALIRAPDARQQSTFSQPDRYAFRMASQRWSMQLGDQNWDATDLLEVGSLGFGVGGDLTRSRLKTGGFVQRSRRVFPDQQQAFAFVSTNLRPNLSMGLNGMAKRSFEEGESASLGLSYEPGNQFFSAEIAQGWFGDEPGRAAQMNMVLQRGASMLSMQAEAADDDFLGAIRGARGGTLSSRVVLSDGLRWTSQARMRQRQYDLGADGRAEQTFGLGRTALTMLLTRDAYRASWTVTAIGQVNDNTLNDLRREEVALESRVTLNRRRFGINAQARRGQSKDPSRAQLDPYLSSQVSLFGSRRSLSVNLTGSLLDGPTFYNPVEQQRVTFGLNLGWDNGSGSRLTVSGLHSEDRKRSEQSFSMADVRFQHQFAFGHEFTLRARTVQTAFETSIRNASFSVAWSVPLFLPVPGMDSQRTELTGRIVDAETGEPIADAIIELDERSASTDSDGRFAVRMKPEGLSYLTVDRSSIGFDRRPIAVMPLPIDPGLVPEGGIEIAVVRSAEVTIRVGVDTGTGGARQSALNTDLDETDKAGVLVEIRSGSERLRRVTDREGMARFPDLVPGPLKVFIVGGSLPSETVSRPDTLSVELPPGSQQELELTIAPERREVRLVGSGGISLSGGIRPVQSVSVSLERDEPAADDQAQENADREDAPAAVDQADQDVATDDERTQESESIRSSDGLLRHTVGTNESLAQLARRYYDGSTIHWIRIWRANRDVISNPDHILPGQVLTIPESGRLTSEERQALLDWADGG